MATSRDSHSYIFTITFVILILATTTITTTSAVAAKPSKTSITFIKSSCKATLYPTLCFNSLALYASSIKSNSQKLTHTALLISLAKTKSIKTYITILSKTRGLTRQDRAGLKDCLENLEAAADRISSSVKEMGRLGRSKGSSREFKWRMSNVQTWVSAALTGENTCGDGLGKGLVGRRVGPMINNAKEVTSNALALINRFVDQKY